MGKCKKQSQLNSLCLQFGDRNNYQRKCFSTKEKETGIERYPQVNQPLNNWLLDGNNQPLNIWAEKAKFRYSCFKVFCG